MTAKYVKADSAKKIHADTWRPLTGPDQPLRRTGALRRSRMAALVLADAAGCLCPRNGRKRKRQALPPTLVSLVLTQNRAAWPAVVGFLWRRLCWTSSSAHEVLQSAALEWVSFPVFDLRTTPSPRAPRSTSSSKGQLGVGAMAQRTLYRETLRRRYHAGICSQAFLLVLLAFVILLTIPYLAAYRSQGFWLREDTYTEQPEVRFKHQLLLQLQTSTGATLAWSTFPYLNRLLLSSLRIPVIKAHEEDINHDGLRDALNLKISMPLQEGEEVVSVKALLLFDYKLHEFVRLQMESAAYFSYESAISLASLNVDGFLRFRQAAPLPHDGRRTLYNTSIIDSSLQAASTYDLPSVLTSYLNRNETTFYADQYPVSRGPRLGAEPLDMTLRIRYPEEIIWYQPGFWQEFKWGWIQFLAYLVPLWFLVDFFLAFSFRNQLVTTIVRGDSFKEHAE
eukprot:m.136558 g.136558  ORF g.136558 m.136558 type:complete len:451 (-) comp9903_c1_seq1:22-1374(-)